MRDFPIGTVTFLFTDIEGSTRRWEADSPAMLSAVERHFALLDEAIAANHGVRFKTIGDAIQAAFPTALDGARAAVTAQSALSNEDWGVLGPIQVRMALHTGAATPRDGDYLAPSLNRLARLLSAGAGGQILVSEATQRLLRDVLPPEIELRDLGEHQLRDLREAEHVYQLVSVGLATDFPSLKSVSRLTNNLPVQLTSFIGRDREIADIKRRLADPTVRLLTLTGPGGTGKTRLALQVATALVDDYPNGVWFVPLAPVASAKLVVPTIAEALGVRETSDQPLAASLVNYLRQKALLLVLDNFEHVTDAAPLVTDLLGSCPTLQIMATSRAPLRVSGEFEYLVPPLEIPKVTGGDPLAAAEASAAVQLFAERARAVRADFVLSDQNAEAIAAICRRLDGLPLAIELAAARIRLLSLDAILARLDSRLTLLTGGERDRPERQQTLRAAIAWSHDMLNQEEEALFRRLAVFAGGWTLDAAEAIANAAEPTISVLDCLAALVENSLVQQEVVETANPSSEPRFSMLLTIQEFARDQLSQSGESDAVRNAHAAFFLNLAIEAKPNLVGKSAVTWLDRLEADHDNLRSALDWFREQGDATQAIQFAAALWRFWLLHGHVGEGRDELEASLALDGSPETPAERAEALDGAGVLAETQGDYERAEALHNQALALSRVREDQAGIARALGNLGVVAFERGDAERAEPQLEESLALARAAGDQALVATALHDLGRAAFHRGDLEQAESLYQESLALRRQIGSDSDTARLLNNLGVVAFGRGEFGQARRLLEESLQLSRATGDKWSAAGPLSMLALAVRKEGDLPRAILLLEESLTHFREIGDARNVPVALLNLAGATRESGNLARAAAYFREALTGFRAVDDHAGVVESLAWIGSLLASEGRHQAAARLFAAATALSEGLEAFQHVVSDQFSDAITAARTALGEEAFDSAWKAGTALSLDDAITEVGEFSPSHL